MLKIFMYLKKSFISVILIILFLIAQAYLDLTLPEYTSKIINVGVQQNGIENAAIKKIRKSSLDKLTIFMTPKDVKTVTKSYQEKYTYNDELVYEIKDNVNEEKIASILAKPMTIVSFLSNPDSKKALKMDIPANTDIFQMLQMLPVSEKEKMLTSINKQFKKYPDTIIDQAAINFITDEYKKIDVDIDKMQINYILKIGLIMIGIALSGMIIGLLTVFVGSRMAANLAKSLREKVFKKVIGFSKNEMKTYGAASLITRTTNDIQQVQMVIVFLFRVVIYAPIIGVGGVIKALNTNSSMTYIIGVAVATILALVILLFAIAMPKFIKIQKLIDKLNLVTREILSGLPVIRAFSNEKYEEERFENANKNLTKVNIFVNRTMSFMMPLMMLIMNFVCLAIVYKGAKGVDTGSMQVGDIMAYIQYTMQIIMAFLMISMMSIMLPRANVSAKRIIEVLETKNTVIAPKKAENFNKHLKGQVEFKNVSFRYPDADYDVITDINLVANPGETTAFIGSTGSGKSTLINLIPRFYDVTGGELLVDGINVQKANLKELRDKIGFVPQKGILFTGSISDNIKYGNDKITSKDIDQALKISQSEEFVSKLKDGKNYQISQGGTNVSGGQKQRLSIARAIAKDPDIFIFDDSFSALDFKTDAKLRKELKTITKNKTVLIVAQRISTIMDADKIVVLHEGNVVGIGKHQDLLKNCQVYQEIALSQLSKEELSNA